MASVPPHLPRPGTGKSVELDVQEQAEEARQQLAAGALPSVLPATKPTERRRNEALQREEGKSGDRLHFSKRMRASSLHEPQVTVNYLAREDGQLSAAPPLTFAMLVSLKAPKGVNPYAGRPAALPGAHATDSAGAAARSNVDAAMHSAPRRLPTVAFRCPYQSSNISLTPHSTR